MAETNRAVSRRVKDQRGMAVLAANMGSYSGNSGETRVTVKGNATVAYSSQALCRASTVMPTVVLAWQQL